jgi:membrane protein DedA with SNARE-associated domain
MIHNIISFIESHAEWATVIVFLIAFIESFVVIGLFLPGWVLLLSIGGLIGADVLNFYSIVIAAYFGAVLGEYISFHLGYYYHQQILEWPFVAKHQKLIKYSHDFFDKHGTSGVFIGRFFGPARSFIPFIAGVCEMSKHKFFWVNAFSGLLWAPLYLIPGILAGAAFKLDQEQSYYLLLTLVVIGIGFGLVYKFNRVLFHPDNQPRFLILIKALLSWIIVIYMLIIFMRSPLWALAKNILSVVWSKL